MLLYDVEEIVRITAPTENDALRLLKPSMIGVKRSGLNKKRFRSKWSRDGRCGRRLVSYDHAHER